jgi:phosphoglucosamine mutase
VGRLFGTDGVRGVANRDLTARLALDLSVAAAHVLGQAGVPRGRRPVAVVGRDPRASGEFLESAVVAGLASAGVDVRRLGVLPTPAVAYLTAATDADFGVMLSASHNPMPDNGIKFFARGGVKLDDAVEDEIEALIGVEVTEPTGADVGRVTDLVEASQQYVDHLVATVPVSLAGLNVVLDCAEGAACDGAPRAFRAAGAEVVAIHHHPDGLNINDGCGSTNLGDLQRAVVEHRADAGFAFDGDADRCLAADAEGQVVDGDQIMAILALSMQAQGTLARETVVATVMSNLGFLTAMKDAGLAVIQARVGDRYVLEEMRTGGYNLGGEQSGHVILSDHVTTGDGILSALQVAARMAATGAGLADLAGVMTRLPQVLLNVPGVDRARAHTDPAVLAAVAEEEAALGGRGRVLLRPSGTEPLVRVMVEAETHEQAEQAAERLAKVVAASLSL